MQAKLASLSVAALLSLTTWAYGEIHAVLQPAPDPAEPGALIGTPGLYDPATKTFTPLAGEPAATAATVSGQIKVNVRYHYNNDFAVNSDRSGDGADISIASVTAFIYCPLWVYGASLQDGFAAGGTPLLDATETISTIFPTDSPITTFSRPFSFTPHGTSPELRPRIRIEMREPGTGVLHRTTIALPAKPLTSGTLVWDVDVNL